MMNAGDIHARLLRPFRPWIVGADLEAIDPWIEVRPDGLPEMSRFLFKDRDLAFDMLHCITAVDYFEPDGKRRPRRGPPPGADLPSFEHPAAAPPGAESPAAALARR